MVRLIRTTDVLLPLIDPRFSWEMFEQFSELLIASHSGGVVHRYGKRGEAQKGIDFYVDLPGGETWTYQCRRYKRFTSANAEKARTELKFKGACKHFILVASEVGAVVRDTVRRWPAWEVLDVRDLSNRVATLPLEGARRILDLHFGSEFRREFLGLRGLTTFLPPTAAFIDNPKDLLHHDVPLQGRREQLKCLEQFASGPGAVAIITAPGGLGKTRLLKAFADRLYKRHAIRFVASGLTVSIESVDDLPLTPVIIVVDDAHARDDIPVLLEIVRQRPIATKLILATRPHGRDAVNTRLSLAGFGRDQIVVLNSLTDLSTEDVRGILRSLLPRAPRPSIETLVEASSKSPLLAVVLARLIREKTLDLTRLSRDPDVRHTVLERFRDESLGRLPNVDTKLAQAALRLLAAIAPSRAGAPEIQQAIATFLGVSEAEVVELIDHLIESGLVRERGYALRVVPDVLADHVLEDACLTRSGNRSTGYATKVFRAFRTLAGSQLLKNLAEVDWRARGGTATPDDVFAAIWSDLRDEFAQSGAYERGRLLETVRDIAFYQPQRALELVEYALRAPLTNDDVDRRYGYNDVYVHRKLAGVLKHVAYHEEYVAVACRLLWQIGRDAEDPPRMSTDESAIRTLRDLLAFERGKPTAFRMRILATVEDLMSDPDAHAHRESLIDVIEAALSREGVDHFMTGPDTLTVQSYLIKPAEQRPLRTRAIEALKRCARHQDPRVVLKAVKEFSRLTKPLLPLMSGQRISSRDQAAWGPERMAAFAELARIARETAEPLVGLEALYEVRWSLDYERDDRLQKAARAVAEAVAASDLRRLTECLVDSRGNKYSLHDDTDIAEGRYEKRWQEHLDHMRDEAAWIVDTFPVAHFLAVTDERLAVTSHLGVKADPYVLLSKIGEVAPDYARSLVETLLQLPEHRLIVGLSSLLGAVIAHEPQAGYKMALDAAQSPDARIAKAATVAMPWERVLSTEEREIAKVLWTHPSEEVRVAVIASSRWFATQNRDFLFEILSRFDLSSQPIATALAAVLDDEKLPPQEIPRDMLTLLVRRFRHVPSLSDWHLCRFLAQSAELDPKLVVGMLLDRIADANDKARTEFEPIPYSTLLFDFDRLARHPEYLDALRMLRDAFRRPRDLPQYYVPILFKRFANVYSAATQTVLAEWLKTKNPELISASAGLLHDAPSAFVFRASEYVVQLLELAWRAGSNCYDDVSSGLYGSAISRMKRGSHGKPFPQDEELRTNALAVMANLEPHGPAWRFYNSLIDHATRAIDWKLRRDEEER